MKKVLNLDLDYEVDELRGKEGIAPVPSNPKITRNIIENAWPENHPKMKTKKAREWRRVVKTIDKAIDDGRPYVALREEDFEAMDKELEACEWPANQAFIVPVLLDEVDRVKALSQKESEEALQLVAPAEENAKAKEQVDKVLQMSQGEG